MPTRYHLEWVLSWAICAVPRGPARDSGGCPSLWLEGSGSGQKHRWAQAFLCSVWGEESWLSRQKVLTLPQREDCGHLSSTPHPPQASSKPSAQTGFSHGCERRATRVTCPPLQSCWEWESKESRTLRTLHQEVETLSWDNSSSPELQARAKCLFKREKQLCCVVGNADMTGQSCNKKQRHSSVCVSSEKQLQDCTQRKSRADGCCCVC